MVDALKKLRCCRSCTAAVVGLACALLLAGCVTTGPARTVCEQVVPPLAGGEIITAWSMGLDVNIDWAVQRDDPALPPVIRRMQVLPDKALYQLMRGDRLPLVSVLERSETPQAGRRIRPTDPKPQPIPLIDRHLWAQALRETQDMLAPPDRTAGRAFSLFDQTIVFFRDTNGMARLARFEHVPETVTDIGREPARRFNMALSASVARHLYARGEDARFVLLQTDVYVEQLLPVVLFCREHERFILLYEPRTPGRSYPGRAVAAIPWRVWNGAMHVVKIAVRPVTSTFLLLDMIKDLAADALTSKGRFARYAEPPPLYDGDGMDIEAWEERLTHYYGSTPSRGNIEFIIHGRTIFERAMAVMSEAEERIDIRTYIFDTDDYAVSFARFLKVMSEHVDVRVLQDGIGTRILAKKRSPGTPLDHDAPYDIHEYLKYDSRIISRLRPNPWLTGDHVKTWIVDDSIAFLGGINIGRQYRTDWHDMMMEIQGPIVDQIAREFRKAWNYSGPWGDLGMLFSSSYTKKRNQHLDGVPMRLVWTKPGSSMILRTHRDAIRRSRGYIYIATPYLASDLIVNEFIRARHRGVDVRVILPEQGNHEIMNANNRVMANRLFQHGVRVFFYPGMSHVKAAVFDGWACLGSANLDRFSLRFNEELNIGTSDPETVQRLIDDLFMPDFAIAEEMHEPFDVGLMDHLSWIIAEYL